MAKSPEIHELLEYRIIESPNEDQAAVSRAWLDVVDEFEHRDIPDPEGSFVKLLENDLAMSEDNYDPYVEIVRHSIAAKVMNVIFPRYSPKNKAYSKKYFEVLTVMDSFLYEIESQEEATDLRPVVDNMLGAVISLKSGDENWKFRLMERFRERYQLNKSVLAKFSGESKIDVKEEENSMREAVFNRVITEFFNGFDPSNKGFMQYFREFNLLDTNELKKLKEPYAKKHKQNYPKTETEEREAFGLITISLLLGKESSAPKFAATGLLEILRKSVTEETEGLLHIPLYLMARTALSQQGDYAEIYAKGTTSGKYLSIYGFKDPINRV